MTYSSVLVWLNSHASALLWVGLSFVLSALVALFIRRLLIRRASQTAAPIAARSPRLALSYWLPPTLVVAATLLASDVTHLLPVRDALAWVHGILSTDLMKIKNIPLTPMSVIIVLVVMVITYQISHAARLALARSLRKRPDADEGTIATLQRLLHYTVITLGGMFALQNVGIDLSAIFAASAVFAVGISFGLQNIAKNFISGIILLIEHTITPGDTLTVDGMVVTVKELGIRATVARSLSNDDLIIPNSLLVENTVINHSLAKSEVSANATVSVSYDSDVDDVMRALAKAGDLTTSKLEGTHVTPVLTGFSPSTLDFTVYIMVPSIAVRGSVLGELRYHIWTVLRDEGIRLSFPQVDVHMDPKMLDMLRDRTQSHASDAT